MKGLRARVVDHLTEIPQSAWDALLDDRATPFMRWHLLEALESTGCAVVERGWYPQHLTLWRGSDLVAAAPAYVKADSAGDFSRDWQWSALTARAGIPYYPKLVVTVPFTPAGGRRVLVAPGEDRAECTRILMRVALELARRTGISSVHVLYHDPDEHDALQAAGMAHRTLFQFHWHNRGYECIDDWLATMRSKRRNQIKRERREPASQGIAIRTVLGSEMAQDPDRWSKLVFALYRDTIDRHMWTAPYLTRAFYRAAMTTFADAIEFVEATREGEVVAGAFNVNSGKELFGRYWGCHEQHKFLHFNVCLYHSVERCIANGVQRFEGGAGGHHKLKRGFEPAFVHSHHKFVDPRLDRGMARILAMEQQSKEQELARYRSE